MIDIKTLKVGEDVQEGVTYRYNYSDGEYITLKRFHWTADRTGEHHLDSIEVTIDTGKPRLGSKEHRAPGVKTTSYGHDDVDFVEEYANLLLEAVALARSLK